MDLSAIQRFVYPKSYIVFDTETTGFSIIDDRILEFAYIVVENGTVTQEFSTLLDHRMEIPEDAFKVHGITYEMCGIQGMNPERGIAILVDKLKTSRLPCITHNGFKFDVPFLLAAVKQYGSRDADLENILWARHVDTAVLAKAAKLGMVRRWDEGFGDFAKRVMDVYARGVKYSLATCIEELGVDTSGITAHRAGGDVRLTDQVYRLLISGK